MSEQRDTSSSTSTDPDAGVPDEVIADAEEHGSMLLAYCISVYKGMEMSAQQTPEGLIYTGHLTNLFVELGLGLPRYTLVTRKMKSMDCIRLIKRGGGQVPSKWLLLQAPNENLFQLPDTYRARVSTSSGAKQMHEQQMRDMNRRLQALETWARRQGYRPEVN